VVQSNQKREILSLTFIVEIVLNIKTFRFFLNKIFWKFLKKIAALLRDDCAFWVGRDAALTAIKENMMSFRDPTTQDEQKVFLFFEENFLKFFPIFSSLGILEIMSLSKAGWLINVFLLLEKSLLKMLKN